MGSTQGGQNPSPALADSNPGLSIRPRRSQKEHSEHADDMFPGGLQLGLRLVVSPIPSDRIRDGTGFERGITSIFS